MSITVDKVPALVLQDTSAGLNEKDIPYDNHELSSVDSSGLAAGGVTDDEYQTLRRVAGPLSLSIFSVAFVELCERFSYYGSIAVLVNFVQQPLPEGSTTGAAFAIGQEQSGALGLGQRASTGLSTFNSFWAYVMPMVGAYLADTYWGRYKTIMWAILAATVGHIILVISAIPSVIQVPNAAVAVFAVGLVIMGIGTGGFKSNISTLIAEQYTSDAYIKTLKSGERVVVDPFMTYSKIYQYFYMCINIGAVLGQVSMVYAENYHSFYLAFALPTVMFLFCPLVMFMFRKKYVRSPPTGSIVSKAFKVFNICLKEKASWNPVTFVRGIKSPDFWTTAKPSRFDAASITKPVWMTFDDAWVDELRRGVKACAVFCFFPIYWLTYNQGPGNLVSQAATMTRNGVPNDLISNLNPITLVIFIPICDKVLYPFLAARGIRFSPIKRITLGFFLGSAAMVWSCVVQYFIYKDGACGNQMNTCEVPAPINVWWQTGPYVLIAFSEIFASITGLEYAFTKAPKNMRSLVMSLFLFATAISSALGQAFVSLADDPLLIWNYAVFAVMAAGAGVVFWFTFRHLDAEEDALNMKVKASTYLGRQEKSTA